MAMYMSSKKTLEINPTNPIMEELRKRSEVGAARFDRPRAPLTARARAFDHSWRALPAAPFCTQQRRGAGPGRLPACPPACLATMPCLWALLERW